MLIDGHLEEMNWISSIYVVQHRIERIIRTPYYIHTSPMHKNLRSTKGWMQEPTSTRWTVASARVHQMALSLYTATWCWINPQKSSIAKIIHCTKKFWPRHWTKIDSDTISSQSASMPAWSNETNHVHKINNDVNIEKKWSGVPHLHAGGNGNQLSNRVSYA